MFPFVTQFRDRTQAGQLLADKLARRGALIRGPRGPAGEYLGAQFGLAPLDVGHVTHRTCGQEHLQEFASVQAWLIPPPPLRT